MATEVKTVEPLVGTKPVEVSATIENVKKASWTTIIGTGLTFLMTNVDVIQSVVSSILPAHWYGVVVALIQLLTALGAAIFGKQAINARVNATQRIVVTKKEQPLSLFIILLILFISAGAVAVVAHAQTTIRPIEFSWTQETPPSVTGFKLYKGKNVTSLVKIADIPDGAARSYVYQRTDTNAACFGMSAVNEDGESTIQIKQDNGSNLCFGKPLPPTAIKPKP